METLNIVIQRVKAHLPENPLPSRDRISEIAQDILENVGVLFLGVIKGIQIVAHHSVRIVGTAFIILALLEKTPHTDTDFCSFIMTIAFCATFILLYNIYIPLVSNSDTVCYYNTFFALLLSPKLHTRLTRLNLFLGLDPNASTDRDNQTLLHFSAEHGNTSLAQILLDHPKTDADIFDRRMNTPLHIAVEESRIDLVRILVASQKSNPNTPNRYYKTPLMLAAEKGNYDMINALLSAENIEVDLTPGEGAETAFEQYCDTIYDDHLIHQNLTDHMKNITELFITKGANYRFLYQNMYYEKVKEEIENNLKIKLDADLSPKLHQNTTLPTVLIEIILEYLPTPLINHPGEWSLKNGEWS